MHCSSIYRYKPLNPFGKYTPGTSPLPYTLTAQPVDQSCKSNYSTSDFIQPQIHHHNHSSPSTQTLPLFLSSEAPTPAKMPTPESASFQAKKPTVPATYDGVDFEDNVAVHNARDAIIREQWVRSMMSRLVGEELSKCYSKEGVNHLEKCGFLRGEWSFSAVLLHPPLGGFA